MTTTESQASPEQISAQLAEALSQPTTAPVTLIKQSELREFIKIQNQIEKLEADLKTRTESLKQLLGSGVPVQPGVHVALLKYSERRCPSWKNEAIKLADELRGAGKGKAWADEVLADTQPTPIIGLDVH